MYQRLSEEKWLHYNYKLLSETCFFFYWFLGFLGFLFLIQQRLNKIFIALFPLDQGIKYPVFVLKRAN